MQSNSSPTRAMPAQESLLQAAQEPEEPAAPRAPHALLIARLPASTLGSREEREWLSELMQHKGRALTYGAQFWVAIITASDQQGADALGETIKLLLTTRYGAHLSVETRDIDTSFTLSPASLSGLAPLPEVMQQMIGELVTR